MIAAKRVRHASIASLEAKLLRCVRAREGMSRTQLARELALAPSTAGIYVDRLIRRRFLMESGSAGRESAGRPAVILLPNPDGGRFVGVDFEAQNILATAVDFSQRPLRQVHRTIRRSDSVQQILARIEEAIAEVIADDQRPVLAIGVGVPGAVDPAAGVALHYPFIPGWRDVPLRARLHDRFGVAVHLENNIRSMALAELWFGQARGLRDFVCIGIRSGVAAGIIVNGELVRGSNNEAGEIGHWLCPAPAELRPPHPRGGRVHVPQACLERIASLSAMVEAAQRAIAAGRRSAIATRPEAVTADALLDAVRTGDRLATRLLNAAASVHAWVAYHLIELFDPQRIIYAGPLAELGELFTGALWSSSTGLPCGLPIGRITHSTLGRFNGALGAAALALHQWEPAR